MLALPFAIFQHSFRLMTFSHDGRGLPKKLGGGLYSIMFAVLASSLVLELADSAEDDWSVWLVANMAFFAISCLIRPPFRAAVFLVSFATNLLMAIGFVAIEGFDGYNTFAFVLWKLSALVVLLLNIVQRSKEESNSKNR